jgi:hypothetical protein
MNIVTSDRGFYWYAVDDDTYHGPGSALGWGDTEEEAIRDLKMQLDEELAQSQDPDEWPEEGDWRADAADDASCFTHGDPFTGR